MLKIKLGKDFYLFALLLIFILICNICSDTNIEGMENSKDNENNNPKYREHHSCDENTINESNYGKTLINEGKFLSKIIKKEDLDTQKRIEKYFKNAMKEYKTEYGDGPSKCEMAQSGWKGPPLRWVKKNFKTMISAVKKDDYQAFEKIFFRSNLAVRKNYKKYLNKDNKKNKYHKQKSRKGSNSEMDSDSDIDEDEKITFKIEDSTYDNNHGSYDIDEDEKIEHEYMFEEDDNEDKEYHSDSDHSDSDDNDNHNNRHMDDNISKKKKKVKKNKDKKNIYDDHDTIDVDVDIDKMNKRPSKKAFINTKCDPDSNIPCPYNAIWGIDL